jgi:hypothetical protein
LVFQFRNCKQFFKNIFNKNKTFFKTALHQDKNYEEGFYKRSAFGVEEFAHLNAKTAHLDDGI